MNFLKNKKGAGDGLAWFVATIVIFFIVIFFVTFYTVSGISQKAHLDTLSDMKDSYFDNLFRQRISGYFINYDIDDVERGKFYYYVREKRWKDIYSFLLEFNKVTFNFLSSQSIPTIVGRDSRAEIIFDRTSRSCAGGYRSTSSSYDVAIRILSNSIYDSPIYYSIDDKYIGLGKFWLTVESGVENREGCK